MNLLHMVELNEEYSRWRSENMLDCGLQVIQKQGLRWPTKPRSIQQAHSHSAGNPPGKSGFIPSHNIIKSTKDIFIDFKFLWLNQVPAKGKRCEWYKNTYHWKHHTTAVVEPWNRTWSLYFWTLPIAALCGLQQNFCLVPLISSLERAWA